MCSCREIIAVNQDKLGKQGKRITKVPQNALNKIMSRSVHTLPEKLENAVLYLRSDLPSTLIRHEKRAPAFRFRVDVKQYGAFRNQWRYDNRMFSLDEFSSKKKIQSAVADCYVFQIFPACERKTFDGFSGENAVSKFLR